MAIASSERVQYMHKYELELRTRMLHPQQIAWAKEWRINEPDYRTMVDQAFSLSSEEMDGIIKRYQETPNKDITNVMEIQIQIIHSADYFLAWLAASSE